MSGVRAIRQLTTSMARTAPQARLDKKRNLLPSLRYEIVKPEKIEQALELLYATYHPDEPLTKHLGLCKGLHSMPDMDRVVSNTIQENLSLFALDHRGKVMGVCINGVSSLHDWTADVSSIADKFQDPTVRPLAAIRQEAHQKGVQIFDEMNTDRLFGIKMVATDPSLRGLGMSTDIIRRSILLAGCLGFEGLKAEVTAFYAQKAFETIGFNPVVEIRYSDFEYEGQRVFAGIEEESGLILYQKKFFQTCLTHIV